MTEQQLTLPGFEDVAGRLTQLHGLSRPYDSYNAFVEEATKTFVQKNTDYDSRFMRALVNNEQEGARAIWEWEVSKKLDRLRTWIKRGELLVQGEGIENSVQDLYVYTVQFSMYEAAPVWLKAADIIDMLTEDKFRAWTATRDPYMWAQFLRHRHLIGPEEELLRLLLIWLMGGQVPPEIWIEAIKAELQRG